MVVFPEKGTPSFVCCNSIQGHTNTHYRKPIGMNESQNKWLLLSVCWRISKKKVFSNHWDENETSMPSHLVSNWMAMPMPRSTTRGRSEYRNSPGLELSHRTEFRKLPDQFTNINSWLNLCRNLPHWLWDCANQVKRNSLDNKSRLTKFQVS